MKVSFDLSDSLVARLQRTGLLNDDAVERLLGSTLDARDADRPLNNAYRTLFEQVHDAVFIVAPSGNMIAVNHRACDLTEYPLDELLTLTFRELSVDVDASAAMLVQLLSGANVPPFERRFRKKSGEIFVGEVTAQLVRDSSGNPQYIQSVVRDITRRKHDEEILRENERLLRQIIDLAPLQIFAKDAHGRYLLANRAAAEAYGTTVEDIVGLTDADLAAHLDEAAAFVEQDRQVLEEGALIVIPEADFTDAQGRKRILRTAKMPLKFPERDELAVLGVSTDITEMRQAANELRQAYRQAYELAAERQHVQILTQFIQDSSHEFRTPLAVISTSIYLMTRTTDEAKRAAHAAQATLQIKRITRLLEQLQTMAEVDGGGAFSFSPVNVNALLREIVSHLPRSEDKRNLSIQLDLDDALPEIDADPARLSQAFEHVLDNAIRFTPADGLVTLGTRSNGAGVVIEIRDTGAGIPPDILPNVTRRFWRIDESHSTPGFGLGLPIAQKIVERHGGTLSVDSPPQGGTVVLAVLPNGRQP